LQTGSKTEANVTVVQISRGSASQAGTGSGLNFDTLREHAETGNAQAQDDYEVRLLLGAGNSIDMGRAPDL
jgi:hypothetical protein